MGRHGTWTETGGGGWLGPVVAVAGGLLALRALAAAAVVVGSALGAVIAVVLWVGGGLLIAAMVGVPTFLVLRRRYRWAHPVGELPRPPWRAERVERNASRFTAAEAEAPAVVVNLHLYPGTDPAVAAEVLARAGVPVQLPRG